VLPNPLKEIRHPIGDNCTDAFVGMSWACTLSPASCSMDTLPCVRLSWLSTLHASRLDADSHKATSGMSSKACAYVPVLGFVSLRRIGACPLKEKFNLVPTVPALTDADTDRARQYRCARQ